MLEINKNKEKKQKCLELIKTITTKTYEEPHIVNLLFSEGKKGPKRGAYVPLKVLLKIF